MAEIIECECRDGCQCSADPGPAMHLIERGGKRMQVCSRCTLPEDTDIEKFAVNRNALTFKDVMDYDPIAAFLLLAESAEEA